MRRLASISSSGSGIAAITASAAASRVSARISLASYVPRSRIRPGQRARPTSGAAAAPMGPFASPSLSIAPIPSIIRRSPASEAANAKRDQHRDHQARGGGGSSARAGQQPDRLQRAQHGGDR